MHNRTCCCVTCNHQSALSICLFAFPFHVGIAQSLNPVQILATPWATAHWASLSFTISWILLKEGNAKECSNYCTIALISHASKVMLKILQAKLQQYVNRELPDLQAGFRKGRGMADSCQCMTKTTTIL